MLNLGGRGFIALLLSLLVAAPPTVVNAANGPAARTALGSIESRGVVRIGEMITPAQNTLFAGDRVQTNNGGALIQYRQGSRISLSSETVANFAPARVQLEKGLMTFESASNSGMIFAASTLRLEPAAGKTAANITLTDSKASVAVTEGTLKVVDPSGLQLASLKAGEARLFEEAPASSEPASASSPAPAAPAAPPQSGGGGGHHWLLATGVALAGVGLGIGGIIKANDADSRADASAATAAAAQSSAAALQTQLTAVQAQANALAREASISAAISADLATQVGRLGQVQAQINTIVSQLAAGQITAAQAQQQLSALQSTLSSILASINADQGLLVACSQPVVSQVNPNCHT